MEHVLTFLQDKGWLQYVTAAVTIASVVASITPTPKPGSFWSKVYKAIDWLAFNVGKAKDKGDEKEAPKK